MRENFFKLMFKAIAKAANEKYSTYVENFINYFNAKIGNCFIFIFISVDLGTEEKKKKNADNYQDADIDDREPEKNTGDNVANGADSSDDEAIGEDDDATAVKLKSKTYDEQDYDEAAVEEEKRDASDVDSDIEEVDNDVENSFADTKNIDETISGVDSNEFSQIYRSDKINHLWCELLFELGMNYKNVDLSIVLKEVAKKSIITEVPSISRAITYNKDGDIFLKTDGININEMFKYMELLNLNRLYTNQIHAMAKTFGIEAAARVIVKEVQTVFQVYGITVDPRHLLLIADYMTFDGTFKPMSRMGMESSASPLQQMSFESTLKFLKNAIVSSRLDNLSSPSSCLMLGQPCKSGTGSFTCLTNNNFLLKHAIKP